MTGIAIQLQRRAGLDDASALHDRDARAQRHRLGLIVRHVHHRGLQFLLKALQIRSHLPAQLRVEVRQRLVHQIDRRVAHERARERHALLLSARKLARLPLEQIVETEAPRGSDDSRFDLDAADRSRAQREGDVVEDREVRIERVVLEDHRHVALGRGHVVDYAIADPKMAYVEPAKQLALMAVDLLWGDAGGARDILKTWKPRMTREAYLSFQRSISKTELYEAKDL